MRQESPKPDPELLRELYPIAVEEYRFAVSQNSDRQKFFVGLNVTVSSVIPNLADVGEELVPWVLILAALSAALGILVIRQSHAYYRNARGHFQHIEQQLGLHALSLGLTTTPGMTGWRRGRRLKVYVAVQLLLGALFFFDLFAAWRFAML